MECFFQMISIGPSLLLRFFHDFPAAVKATTSGEGSPPKKTLDNLLGINYIYQYNLINLIFNYNLNKQNKGYLGRAAENGGY